MAHGGAGGQQRQVVVARAVAVHDGCQEQRRIGDAAGHDDWRLRLQGAADHVRAQIGICRGHSRQQRFERLPAFQQHQVRPRAEQVGDVIAQDDGASDPAEACILGEAADLARRGGRVRRAHVGDDPDAALEAGGQRRRHALDQPWVVAARRVLLARQVLARDGALGEALEYQVVELAAQRQVHRRLDAVVGEARTDAHAQPISGSRHVAVLSRRCVVWINPACPSVARSASRSRGTPDARPAAR